MPRPPSDRLYRYRVRVDGLFDDKVIQFFRTFASRWILVHHETPTENPHYHCYAETTYSQGNYSNRIKDVLGVKGTDYSNKKCDEDRVNEYCTYLFNLKKGNKPRYVSSEGFSPLDVSTYRETAAKNTAEFLARIQSSKKTQYEIVELVIERVSSEELPFPEYIYPHVIDVMRINRMVARPHHVRDIISSVMAYADNPRANARAKELALKFFL